MLRATEWPGLAGPTTAFLHELDAVSLGPTASLWPLFVIVLVAVLGIFLVLRIGPDFRLLRWLAIAPNGLVLCYYGFFLLFFGLGASR